MTILNTDQPPFESVKFSTQSRDQAVFVAYLIGKYLQPKILLDKGYKIGIYGGYKDGKSAILDSILFTIMDEKDPFKAPIDNKMYLESKPNEGGWSTINKLLRVFNNVVKVGFRNVHSLRQHRSVIKADSDIILSNGGLFLFSYRHTDKTLEEDAINLNADIIIKTHSSDESMWKKKWEVVFINAQQDCLNDFIKKLERLKKHKRDLTI